MKKKLRDLLCNRNSILLMAITLLGLLLRMWGADFGLPQTYHIDELHYVPDAVRYISTMNFQPSRWANPTFFKYLLALEYAIIYLVTRVIGQIESLAEFEALFRNNPSIFYLLGRLSSGAFGTATIPVIYGIGTQAYGRKKGLIAALLMALCFLHARDSHYAVSDVPMTFFFSAAILCCLLYLRHRASKYLYGAASLTGLAIATKYTALILVVVFMTTWALVKYSGDWRDLVKALSSKELFIAFAIMGLSFLFVCPYALVDYRGFLGSLRSHYGMGKTGFAGYRIDPANGWIFYLETLRWGMGVILATVALFSIGYALYKHRQVDLIVALPVLLLYVYLGRQQAHFSRFIIPALPLLIVMTAGFLSEVAAKFSPTSRRSTGIVAVVLAILAVVPSAVAIAQHNILLMRTDTRTIGKQWIESHIPAGTKLFVEWHTPPLATERQPVPNSNRTYKVSDSDIIGLAEHPLDYYRQHGYQYLIASSFIYDIPRMEQHEDESRRAFYRQVEIEAELVKVIRPYSQSQEPPFIFAQLYGPATSLFQFDRPGPTIKIYRLQ